MSSSYLLFLLLHQHITRPEPVRIEIKSARADACIANTSTNASANNENVSENVVFDFSTRRNTAIWICS